MKEDSEKVPTLLTDYILKGKLKNNPHNKNGLNQKYSRCVRDSLWRPVQHVKSNEMEQEESIKRKDFLCFSFGQLPFFMYEFSCKVVNSRWVLKMSLVIANRTTSLHSWLVCCVDFYLQPNLRFPLQSCVPPKAPRGQGALCVGDFLPFPRCLWPVLHDLPSSAIINHGSSPSALLYSPQLWLLPFAELTSSHLAQQAQAGPQTVSIWIVRKWGGQKPTSYGLH